jgi:hypothetical protein
LPTAALSSIFSTPVITASTEATLRALRDAHIVDRFYLADGTGLALQFGHRLSLGLVFLLPSNSMRRLSSSAFIR